MNIDQQNELISVIVPVYNIETYLPRFFKALSDQTYTNLEILFVDDCSSDKSGKLCEEFAAQDPRARVIHHNLNKGAWAARNTGQEASHGAYLWFVDGDDYFHKDILRLMHTAINREDKYDVAIVGWKQTEKEEEVSSTTIHPRYTELSQEAFLFSLHSSSGVQEWNKLYRKELIRDIRSHPYPRAHDRDFNLRVALKVNRAIRLDCVLYYWRQHPGSLTHDSYYSYCSCITELYYRNYLSLPEDKKKYGFLFLQNLYYWMIHWKQLAWNTNNQKTVFRQCKEYEQSTWKAYCTAREISIIERFICCFLFLSPRFVHRLSDYKAKGHKTRLSQYRFRFACFLLKFAYL